MSTGRRMLRAATATAVVLLGSALLLAVLCEALYLVRNGSLYALHNARHRAAVTAPSADEDRFARYREAFPLEKRPDTVRILAVGGSTTFGFGLPAKAAWPARLAACLEDEAPGRYEVLNLGRLGGHLEEFIENFQASLTDFIPREHWLKAGPQRLAQATRADWGWKDLAPELVLLAPVVNDTAPDYVSFAAPGPLGRRAASLSEALGRSPLDGSLALVHYLRLALHGLAARDAGTTASEAQRLAVIRERYARNLKRFIGLWRGRAEVRLLGLPLLFSPGDGPDEAARAARFWGMPEGPVAEQAAYLPALEQLEREVRAETARKLGIAHLELGETIKARPFNDRLRLYLDAIHLTAQGHDALARELAREMLDRPNN